MGRPWCRRLLFVLAVLAGGTLTHGALAEELSCSGCVVLSPGDADAGSGLRPLLVTLHGDDGAPHSALRPWKKTAMARGFVLFAPRVPQWNEWWKWGGHPEWIESRVRSMIGPYRIDPSRIYIAGWSGGATYLTRKAPLLTDLFAAVAVLGGGLPPGCRWDGFRCQMPKTSAPCGAVHPPVYYLSGTGNGMHQGAVQARDYLRACGSPVHWELLSGVNHPGEFFELLRPERTNAILDWLLAHAKASPPDEVGDRDAGLRGHESLQDAAEQNLLDGSRAPEPDASMKALTSAPPPVRGAPKSGCSATRIESHTTPTAWILFAAFAGAFLRRRQRP